MPKLPIFKFSNWREDLSVMLQASLQRDAGDFIKFIRDFFATSSLAQFADFLGISKDAAAADYFALTKIEVGNIPYPFSGYGPYAAGTCTVTNNPYFDAGASSLNVNSVPACYPRTGIICIGETEFCYYYYALPGATTINIYPDSRSGRNYPYGGIGIRHYMGETVRYVCPFAALVGNHEFQISPPGSKKGGVFMPIILRYLAERFIKKTTTTTTTTTGGSTGGDPGTPYQPSGPLTPPGGGPGCGGGVDDPGNDPSNDEPSKPPGLLMT
ncbi:MAG: hypothetical protein ABSH28_01390 [Acidobacteriota bacterium]|jgi:hypothetical protein